MHSRSLKIAGVAALAGMMMAVAILGATKPNRPAPVDTTLPAVAATSDPLTHELDRCATLTMPDAGCESAWAENRRRFFGQSGLSGDTDGADRPLPAAEGARP